MDRPQSVRGRFRNLILRGALPAVALLALGATPEARAQVVPGGFGGGWGWGGWGSDSVPGSAFRGLGAFSYGLGAGDRLSAEADAIRTQSFMELNEYLYRSSMLQRQRAAARNQADRQRAAEARDALQDRRVSDPSAIDVESGDTLNNLLFELDNPAIPDSVIRDASEGITIPGRVIQQIPFMFTHRGVAISLQRLLTEGQGWPPALRDEALAPLRERYEDVVERIVETPEGEPVPDELIGEARTVLREMYQAVQQSGLTGPPAAEALRHLKAQAGMVTMLQQPDVKQVIDEAAEVEQVALPNLLGFMRHYNLQFGAAETPEEKAVYGKELYPKMARLREALVEQFGGSLPGSGSDADDQQFAGSPTGAFEGFDWDQLGLPEPDGEKSQDQPRLDDEPAPSP